MSVLSEIIHNFVNVGGIISLLVVVFLISKILSKDQLFSSSYFILYGISLIVQIANVLIWELWTIWPDDDVIHLLDNIIFNYESGFVGFWNVLLAMNRCTIFVFPIWHAKVCFSFKVLSLLNFRYGKVSPCSAVSLLGYFYP